MPWGDPDANDPIHLQRMIVESEDDVTREMAECFILEYLRMGYPAERVLSMFQIPEYIGPSKAWRELGEATIAKMVDQAASFWNGRRSGNRLRRDREGNVIG
jgi:hypothetical protein